MDLTDRNILITGGRRVGAKLAVELAQRGANIALSYFQSRERIEAVADELRALGVKAVTLPADLRNPEDVDALVAQTVRELGSLDCLVNMTSTFEATPFDELTPADFDAAIESNLRAPYLTALAAARAMLDNPVTDGNGCRCEIDATLFLPTIKPVQRIVPMQRRIKIMGIINDFGAVAPGHPEYRRQLVIKMQVVKIGLG